MTASNDSAAIDCHAHVFSREGAPILGSRYRPEYAATPEMWRSLWPQANVGRGVLVQPSFFGTHNEEMLAALARDPERLRGVAVVDPWWNDMALARLATGGVRAIRLNLVGFTDYSRYGAEEWLQLYRRLGSHGLHLEIFVDRGRLPDIAKCIESVEVTTIFDHFGNPGEKPEAIDATFAAVARLARTRPVGCKFSGLYRMGAVEPRVMVLRWCEAAGHERLLWGSDWPWTRHEAGREYGALRAEMESWMEPALAHRVLWDNAAALYGFA